VKYEIKRTVQALFTLWVSLTLTFAIIRWMPGGPVDFLRAELIAGNISPGASGGSEAATDTSRIAQAVEYYMQTNPEDPVYIQYIDWLQAILSGNLGNSIYYQKPVASIFAEAVPFTVFIMSLSVIMSFLQQVIIGGLLANLEGSRFDVSATTFIIWFHSIPFFIWGILLLAFLSFQLGWFPTSGKVDPTATVGMNVEFIGGVIYHAILPVTALAFASLGTGVLSMRGNAIQIIGKDYVRVARLRGLTSRRISVFYIARNAILPMYTQLLLSMAYIFGGSLILEAIFQYHGLGWYTFRGLQSRDYPLLMGGFILFIIITVVVLYIADLTYPYIDPRIKEGETNESF